MRRHVLAAVCALGTGYAGSAVADETTTAQIADVGDYTRVCGICHLDKGQGVPGAFPPLDARLAGYAGTEEGRNYLVGVLQNGLYGPITVNGTNYVGAMPPVAGQLDDEGMAAMLNYVLATFADAEALATFTSSEVTQRKATVGTTNSAELRKALQ